MAKNTNHAQASGNQKPDALQNAPAEPQQNEIPANAGTPDNDIPAPDALQNAPAEPQQTGSADTGSSDQSGQADSSADAGKESKSSKKVVKMVLRHKSHTPHYHRCGLTITQVFAEYDVPEESVEKIKADKWIVIKD